jgi:hypothetical protein
MDSVSTLDQVVALLRQQLAERTRPSDRAAPHKDVSARPSCPEQSSRRALETLTECIAALRTSGVDDPERLSRTVVEWLLAREFGASVVNDPEFQQMVDEVSESVRDDPESAAGMKQLLSESAR